MTTATGTTPPERQDTSTGAGFFGALFDFSFTSFITTKLIPVLYGIVLVMIVLSAIGLLTRGGVGVILAIFLLAFGVIYARVIMETIIVFFRIAEHTRDTAAAIRALSQSAPAGPPPAQSGPRFDPQTGQPLS
ncbi:MAG TPA: DUF4282 domain-containing protein [Gaiellales bacterium]|nr:DUF4282 domain-containing protein [Gaiellales bacterium]